MSVRIACARRPLPSRIDRHVLRKHPNAVRCAHAALQAASGSSNSGPGSAASVPGCRRADDAGEAATRRERQRNDRAGVDGVRGLDDGLGVATVGLIREAV